MDLMSIPALQGNWIDLVIIVVLIYFASQAVRIGLWIILSDFLSFLTSLLIALRGYPLAAEFLRSNFTLSHSLANALGFLMVAILAEGVINYALTFVFLKLPDKYWKNWWSRSLAILPSVGEGLVLISFFLIFVISLPVSPSFKNDIFNSKIGGYLVGKTSAVETKINEVFGGVIEESLTYLTIRPGSTETIPINTGDAGLSVDSHAERQMLELVNEERVQRGLNPLGWRDETLPPAREHARDMWERQYFGHTSPDGEDVGDRLDRHGVGYFIAGENLALAPTVDTAHQGLMNSEGHRANILEPRFNQIAIGVIDNGVYGKMFVQIFTD